MSNTDQQSEKKLDDGSPVSTPRRTFLAGLTAASYSRIWGANERLQLGFIGCGIIARNHLMHVKPLSDVEIVATCDAYMPRAEQCVADYNPKAKAYQDFRRLLENKDIQAVFISTPSHWHALQTIMACAAGKDVYVEKPVTVAPREGRWIVEAARRYKRVVQCGTQQRSLPHYQKAATQLEDVRILVGTALRFFSLRDLTDPLRRPCRSLQNGD